jgi:hypothetical protein
MSEEQPADYSSGMDSDAILVGAYVLKCDLSELRRYVAMDLVTAMQPLTKESIPLAKQIEAFLQGKPSNMKVVE